MVKNSKIAGVFILATLAASILGSSSSASAFAGGDGSAGNPWQIATCADLQSMNDGTASYDDDFIVTADIDCAGAAVNVIDFGNMDPLEGTFDGGGRTISNFTLATGHIGKYGNGLFTSVYGGTVKNLTLSGVSLAHSTVDDAGRIGLLAGWAEGGAQFENVTVTGSLTLDYPVIGERIGGLVGYSSGNVYQNIITNIAVTSSAPGGNNYHVGGLIGRSENDQISKVAVLGNVTLQQNESMNIGGLIGRSVDTSISEAFVLGNVSVSGQTGRVGGLIGWANTDAGQNVIEDSYALGNVIAPIGGNVGSLVGMAENLTATRTYAAGAVTHAANADAGGLVAGTWNSSSSASFWDTQTSSLSTSALSEIGKTTTEMKDATAFTTANWDFASVWRINASFNSSYPCLRWYSACTNDPVSPTDPEQPAAPVSPIPGAPNTGTENVATVLPRIAALLTLSLLAIAILVCKKERV